MVLEDAHRAMPGCDQMNVGLWHYLALFTAFITRRKLFLLVLLLVPSFLLVLISIQHSHYMHDMSFRSMSASTFGFDYEGPLNVSYDIPSIQTQRLRTLEDYCTTKKRARRRPGHKYKVNHQLRVVYCPVGKVASSSWIGLLKQATGDFSKGRRSKRLKHIGKTKMSYKGYFKFMFVRHPFDRLVSAYKNKFQDRKSDYIKELAPKIIRLYRSRLSFNSDPTTVTFPEFVSYLVDERNHPLKDFHWTPQIDLCSPCGGRRRLGHINFDFIGHYETLYDDTDYVLDRLNIHPSSSMPLSYRQRNASRLRGWQSRVRAAFVSIPDDHKASLKRIYRFDFDAFGYSSDVI